MYSAAFVLAILVNLGHMTWWKRWNDPVPRAVVRSGLRNDIEEALFEAFGFPADAVLPGGSAARTALGHSKRLLLEVLFKPTEPSVITVVREGTPKTQNSIGLDIDHGAWIWGNGGGDPIRGPVEYQIGNTFRQQNGIFCSLTARQAAASGSPETQYAIPRTDCEYRTAANSCRLGDDDCASDGAGGTRIPKPRVFVSEDASRPGRVLTPTAFTELIGRAVTDKQTGTRSELPKAQDLALITGWAHRGDGNSLSFGRLVALLGHDLLPMLTAP